MADETKTEEKGASARPLEKGRGAGGRDNLSQTDGENTETESLGTSEEDSAPGSLGKHEETASGQEKADGSVESPVRLTQIAAEKIGEVAAGTHLGEYRLRVKVIGGGCAGFSYDLAFEEKTVVDAEGEKRVPAKPSDPVNPGDILFVEKGVCLVIDQMSLMYLRGTEIDYVETLAATGFKFDNPNTSSTCGCGSSFSV